MGNAGGEFTFTSTTSTRLPPRQDAAFQGEDGMIQVTVPCNAGVAGEAQVHLVRGNATIVERFPTGRHYVLQMQPSRRPCETVRRTRGRWRTRRAPRR